MIRGNWTDNPCFYVMAEDAGRQALILGPFHTEEYCREWAFNDPKEGGNFVRAWLIRMLAEKKDPGARNYTFGMIKTQNGYREGILNNKISPNRWTGGKCLLNRAEMSILLMEVSE